ncbi:DUF481 domain-containing protein [Aliidiomarina sedimenti]|uniref:DUF481 domain-containing protein n=1 Tax=Aliidiomarina sedimenti TaxID=1933879 RepID=UPI001F5448B3|nr:DUF481 domain-containing protein [Aliidiomarina sedimenti]
MSKAISTGTLATFLVAALPGFVLSSAALAQENQAEAEDQAWKIETEVGLLIRTGNTESQSWKGKLNLARDVERWRHQAEFDYYRQETENEAGEDVIDADRFFAAAQTNRKFSDDSRSSLFLYGSYEDDRLNSYDFQSTIAAGYGNRYTWNEGLYADFEIGPGYSYDKRIDTGETSGEWILRLAGKLNWDITANSRFTQSMSTEVGNDNTRTRSVSALTANINSSLAMRVSLTLTHNDTVYPIEDGSLPEKLDTETAVTLVYSF